MRILICILCLALMGCATPSSYKGKMTDDGLEITVESSKFLGIFDIGNGVPAGKYHYKEGDRELDVDTKAVPLINLDLNAAKVN